MVNKNNESEPTKENQNRVPILTSGIGTRIRDVATDVGGIKKLSELIGLSEAQMHRVIKGDSRPNIEAVASIAKEAGVRLEWLITGEGVKFLNNIQQSQETRRPGDIDLDLLERVATATFGDLQARGLRLEPAALARLVRVLYRHFASRGENPDQDTVSNIIDLAAYR